MKILVTNDDGINAPGLKILKTIALQLADEDNVFTVAPSCLLYTSPSPRDGLLSRMPSSA